MDVIDYGVAVTRSWAATSSNSMPVRFVRACGQTVVYTFNDVGNVPMIAVNENVGFRRGERFYLVWRKPVQL